MAFMTKANHKVCIGVVNLFNDNFGFTFSVLWNFSLLLLASGCGRPASEIIEKADSLILNKRPVISETAIDVNGPKENNLNEGVITYDSLRNLLRDSLLVLQGTIDGQYNINMVLGSKRLRYGFEVVGRYSMQGQKGDPYIKGGLNGGRLVLQEQKKLQVTATFDGALTGVSYNGFLEKNGEKQDFELKVISDGDYLSLKGMEEYSKVKERRLRELLAFSDYGTLPHHDYEPGMIMFPFHLMIHFFGVIPLSVPDTESGAYYPSVAYVAENYVGIVYQYVNQRNRGFGTTNSTFHLMTYSFDGKKISNQITIGGSEKEDLMEMIWAKNYSSEITLNNVQVNIKKTYTEFDENRNVVKRDIVSQKKITYKINGRGRITK